MMKRILILFAFLLGGAAFAIAQTPNNIRWVHKIEGIPAPMLSKGVHIDKQGNSFLLERRDPSTPSVDSLYFYLVKIDPMGDLLWQKRIITQYAPGGSSGIPYNSIAFTMDYDGDFYLASGFLGIYVFNNQPTNIQTPDYQGKGFFWVAKWNHDGEFQWVRNSVPSYNPLSDQTFYDLLTDQSGAVYLNGAFSGTQDFNPGLGTSIHTSYGSGSALNPFLWKLDASGNFGWFNNFGGNSYSFQIGLPSLIPVNRMAISSAKRMEGAATKQKIFLIGAMEHSSDFDPGPGVTTIDSGKFMAEYKTNGDLVWAGNLNNQNSTDAFTVQGVAMDTSNNVYLTGGYWNSPNIAGPNATSNYYLPNNNATSFSPNTSNAFVAKLDSTGNVDWAKVIERDSTKGYAITGIPIVDNGNHLYIPGSIYCDSCSLNFNTVTNPVTVTTLSSEEGYVLKLAANTGNFDWLYRTHGIQNSNGCDIFSVAGDQYNNVFADGTVINGVSFNMSGTPNIWYPVGGFGSFLIKLGECPPNVDSATAYACHSYVLGGQSFDSSGFYAVQLPASNSSCDSIVALTLHLQPIDPSISTDGDTLIANAPGATYQWLHCDGNGGYQLVPGATDRHFIPPTPGNYAVAVSYQDCKDTSGCVLGIENVSIGANVQIAPNPATNQFHVSFSQAVRHMHLKLINAVGQTLWQETDFSGQTLTVNMQQYSAGLYYLSIQNEKGVVVKKVVKW